MKRKNPAAVALGKRRAKQFTSEHQSAAAKAQTAGMTDEQKREIGIRLAAARAKKRAAENKSASRKSNSGKG